MVTAANDAELLRRYVHEKSDARFAELVRRHINLIFSVASRPVGSDVHLAQAQISLSNLLDLNPRKFSLPTSLAY